MQNFRIKLGKITPKGNLLILNKTPSKNADMIQELVSLLSRIRNNDDAISSIIGFAFVGWNSDGYTYSKVVVNNLEQNRFKIHRLHVPTLVEEAVREFLISEE